MTREWLEEIKKIETNVIKLARIQTVNEEKGGKLLSPPHNSDENEIQKETE